MPVTLVDRLPLPNLKVYTAGSVSLLSIAVYYALSVTSDPNWRVNATQGRQDAMAEPGDAEARLMMADEPALTANDTRNVTEQFVDVMAYMMQEPLCMWTLINIAYCSLAVFGFGIQRVVFGQLRVAEAQRVKDKFWNYVFYKFIFVFGVINVQYMDEVLLWCSWFTLVGFLHLLGQLCKDRYEYLSSSPNTGGWAHVRLACLLVGILTAATALLGVAAAWGLPAGRDTFAFMAAECILVLVAVLHVAARYALALYECDVAGPVAYYTHLVFDSVALVAELLHVLHMVVHSNMLVSMASLVLLMQLRHLLHELQARARRHRLYTQLATHMSRNYPMASKEEVEKNQDNCAICWEPMKEARKLPCSHLFHNSCLCQWVQQDASCPTCRRALAASAHPRAHAHANAHPNHLFHFDGSRYVSWLPSFSVEVTRVRGEPPAGPALDSTAQQLQHMFPQYPIATLAADLARTASADLTLDNILEGRLEAPEAAALDAATSTVEPWTPPPSAFLLPTTSAGTDTRERANAAAGPSLAPDLLDDFGAAGGFSRSAAEREAALARRKAAPRPRRPADCARRLTYCSTWRYSSQCEWSPAPPRPDPGPLARTDLFFYFICESVFFYFIKTVPIRSVIVHGSSPRLDAPYSSFHLYCVLILPTPMCSLILNAP